MFAYQFPKLVNHFTKLEALAETRGAREAAIHEPAKALHALLATHTPAKLKDGLRQINDRLQKHVGAPGADPKLRAYLAADVADHAASAWAHFDALARGVYGHALAPDPATIRGWVS